jgi:predicted neuraminidase
MSRTSRLLLCSIVVALPAVARAEDPPSPIVLSEFIYDSGSYPQIHATTIVETPTGLVAAWFGGSHERNPDVGIWVSRQVEGQWSASVEVANGVQHTLSDGTIVRHPTWNPVLFQPKDGPLLLFYKAGPSPQTWWGMLTTSADGGQTWEQPRRLPEGILGPIKNKPLQLADGTILCPASEESKGESNQQKWSVHFERTSDWGKTWERTLALHDGLAIQAIQPSILLLPNEQLLAIGRTQQDKVFEIRSTDGGKTWGEIALGPLPNNNSGIDAVTLKDSTHLIVYNHVGSTGKRTPLNLSASSDGATWQAALVLESESGEFSYPAIIQSSDDLVHITYTWNRRKVKHVVIDPAKLALQPLVKGNWPGVSPSPKVESFLPRPKANSQPALPAPKEE